MKSLLNRVLFKSHSQISDSGGGQNPWLKEGEYIYLHSKKGRHEVVSVKDDGFYVRKEYQSKNHAPVFHRWNDFKRWSSKAKDV